MSAFTLPIAWRTPLSRSFGQNPICCGPTIVVTDDTTLRAFDRSSGKPAWSVTRSGRFGPVVAVNGGCIAVTSDVDGDRIEMFDHAGQRRWELPGPWNVWLQGLVGAGDRFVLSGTPRDAAEGSRLYEISVADGAVRRSVPGASRPGIVTTEDGWAWLDAETDAVHLVDAGGDRIVITAEVQALAWASGLLFADGDGALRAFDANGVTWERPGGKTHHLAADARGVVCGYLDVDGLWICAYALDGANQWKAGPFTGGYPAVVLWDDLVIASGIDLGQQTGVAMLDRADGRVRHVELGSWAGDDGHVALDGDSVFVAARKELQRRDRRRWRRSEDAWDPSYLVAVAAQLAIGGDGPDATTIEALEREIGALRAAGVNVTEFLRDVQLVDPMPDLAPLRDAVASYRAAGRASWDPLVDAVAWLFCDADWPLWALDVDVDDRPDRRVELMTFDSEVERPSWARRDRITQYPQLRYLSLCGNALTGALGIELPALPRLAYLDLSDNRLERMPPGIAGCRSLVRLLVRGNDLATLAPEELPRSLRWLDVAQNRLADATIARVRDALPDCRIISYAQRP